MELPVRIYTADNKYNLKRLLLEGLQGYREGLHLARQIFVRDFKASYRTSYFAGLWILFPTLSSALLWIVLRGTGVIDSAEAGIPYPLFVLAGTAIWSVITECLTEPLAAFNANKGIVTKINFPKEALVVLAGFNLLYKLVFKILLLGILLMFFRVAPSSSLMLFLPLLAIAMIALVSVGVLLLPLEILLPDFSRLKNAVLPFLMYAAPVVFVKPGGGWLATIMAWNPFTYLIEDLRYAMTGQAVQYLLFWVALGAFALVTFILATIVYRVAVPIIIQRMSA